MKMTKYKLGELVEVTRGASLSGQFYAEEGKLIRLTLGNFNMNGGGFKENTSKTDLYFTGTVRDEFILNKGDIITPLTEQSLGLLGTTARIPESGKYIQSQDVALVRCKEGLLDPNFCYYLISSSIVRQQLSAAAQQTKIRHTSPEKIKDCTVWVPDFEVQKNIGRILTDIDNKIAINRRINDNLEAMAKQLYDYWFVQFDFPNEEGKPYKSSGGAMVWNDKLKREIPQGWSECVLGDICEMYQPKTLGLNELSEDGEYKVYGANGIIGHYSSYNHENSEIAMACRGNSCGTINRTSPKSWITGNAMVVKIRNKEIHNEYIKQALKYANVKGAISGSGQPQLTRENLSVLKLIQPNYAILEAFSKKVAAIVAMELEIEEQNDNLTKQRDELLPLLMNGQASVNYHLSAC